MEVTKDCSEALTPQSLVSLIVPIFNAEKYLRQCIISLQNQTYRNIEIILINDGSEDSSGDIINSFVHLDNRVKILHQENMGVSTARNAGLEIAQGEHVSFVDADDWLSPYFVEVFVCLAQKYNADFVLSKNVLTAPVANTPSKNMVEIWSRSKSIDELLYAEILIGCWNKLYRRSLIYDNGIDFDSRFFMGEGLNFITSISCHSTKILATDAPLYYYRRDNPASATSFVSIRKMKNALAAIDNISSTLGRDNKTTEIAVAFHRWHTAFFSLVAFRDQGSPRDEEDFYRECMSYIKNNSFRMLIAARISKKRRALVLANTLFPDFAVWAYRLLKNHRSIHQMRKPNT